MKTQTNKWGSIAQAIERMDKAEEHFKAVLEENRQVIEKSKARLGELQAINQLLSYESKKA